MSQAIRHARAHISARDRAKIHAYFEADWSRQKISQRLSIPYSTVCRVLNGPETPTRQRSSYNQLVLATPIRFRLKQAALANRFTPFQALARHLGIEATKEVLRASMDLEGLARFRSRIKPKTNSTIRQKRLAWCHAREHWTVDRVHHGMVNYRRYEY